MKHYDYCYAIQIYGPALPGYVIFLPCNPFYLPEQPMKLAPQQFGLPARTVLEQIDANTIAIVINRKSRLIMADGKKILEKSRKIRESLISGRVVLKTTAPVCGKTVQVLEAEGIELIPCQP